MGYPSNHLQIDTKGGYHCSFLDLLKLYPPPLFSLLPPSITPPSSFPCAAATPKFSLTSFLCIAAILTCFAATLKCPLTFFTCFAATLRYALPPPSLLRRHMLNLRRGEDVWSDSNVCLNKAKEIASVIRG